MMKRWIACLAVAALLLAALAGAEGAQAPDFEELSGLDWLFCSGAGGWYTAMQIGPDGAFTGDYHDSEMGEVGEGYPDGTIYGCRFHGQMTMGERAGEYAWTVHVDALELDEGQVPEAVEDGVRYVTVEPYGISAGIDLQLYLPGTPVSALPEDFLFWAHLFGDDVETLPYYGLYDAEGDAGFIGEPAVDGAEE